MNKMCFFCFKRSVQHGRCTSCGRIASASSGRGANDALLPGTQLDHGSIIVGEVLGHGGFGITYVAQDSTYGVIALKEFFPRSIAKREGTCVTATGEEDASYERYMADFKREVKHLLNLQAHPNIIKVLFDISENNTFYYGMELLQGESLRALLNRKGRMDPGKAFQLLEPILDALIFAHNKKTLHRDIAPDNIFLRNNPRDPENPSPCLIDFGAAFTDKNGFTFVAPAVAKRGFSPPDQGLPYDQQGPFIDVYAITATYYNMVKGHVPPPAVERQNKGIISASALNPAVSAQLEQVISKGMELNHEKRYQTVTELKAALHAALEPKRIQIALLICDKGPMKGTKFTLNKASLTIGREADLRISDMDRLASRKHCKVIFAGGCWYIEDLKSHNGTSLNHQKIPAGQRVKLAPNVLIGIGQEEFLFNIK